MYSEIYNLYIQTQSYNLSQLLLQLQTKTEGYWVGVAVKLLLFQRAKKNSGKKNLIQQSVLFSILSFSKLVSLRLHLEKQFGCTFLKKIKMNAKITV